MFKKEYTGLSLVTATAVAADIGCMVGLRPRSKRTLVATRAICHDIRDES